MKRQWLSWGRQVEVGVDSWEKGGKCWKRGWRGTAQVVWGKGGSRSGGRKEIGGSIPAELGADEGGIEKFRRDMERQIAMGRNLRLVMERGDFNASVGSGGGRRGVCRRYVVGRGNEPGRDLVEWCKEIGMAHVNGFIRYKRRGYVEMA